MHHSERSNSEKTSDQISHFFYSSLLFPRTSILMSSSSSSTGTFSHIATMPLNDTRNIPFSPVTDPHYNPIQLDKNNPNIQQIIQAHDNNLKNSIIHPYEIELALFQPSQNQLQIPDLATPPLPYDQFTLLFVIAFIIIVILELPLNLLKLRFNYRK